MNVTTVEIEKPEDLNVVLGHAHFIKTVDDLYEALARKFTPPPLRPYVLRVVRCAARTAAGNDPELVDLAVRNAQAVGAGHSFVVFLREGSPVNVLNQLKQESRS